MSILEAEVMDKPQQDSARELIQAHLVNAVKQEYSGDEIRAYKKIIKPLLKSQNAVIIAHYYTDPSIQALAEETGGIVSDSLEMARFGKDNSANTLIVAGVKFMGETAKILSPEKRVLMPTLEATCSLDLGCPIDGFSAFCDEHPDREVVVYANTSAAVKARSDWVVTSSIAVQVIDYLDSEGKKIIWAPDKYLGDYVRRQTGADMLLWDGSCIVHEEFKAKGIEDLKAVYPKAVVLVHPESPRAVTEIADVVGSTSQLIQASKKMSNKEFIVATDEGIFYKMQQASPDKKFLIAPTAGRGATCRSCANCPWMAMNNMERIIFVLRNAGEEIHVDPDLGAKALKPLERMLKFKAESLD